MTITTTTEETKPEVPAWLNLDGYCPPETRNVLEVAAEAVERLLADGKVDAVCQLAWEALTRYEEETQYDLDDQHEMLNTLSGFGRLHDATAKLWDLAAIAHGEKPYGLAPSWFEPYGVDAINAAKAEEVQS